MKFTNNTMSKVLQTGLCMTLSLLLFTGCGKSYGMSYIDYQSNPTFGLLTDTSGSAEIAKAFAADLCIADGDMEGTSPVDMTDTTAAAIFDVNRSETLYAKNVYTKLYPASMTKVMTALVALKYSTSDTVLTASNNVNISESGAQVCGIATGDTMTLDQALHLLLIYSANDAAVMIAENVGGSVEQFTEMMNNEAKALGATNTNFVNSNGLSDENHYSTAYDMYLIFNEAIKYDLFKEIINMTSYSTVYYDANQNEKNVDVTSTNLYLQGAVTPPANVTVIGGKTGTTNAAGHCLIMLSRDTSGNPYISIVMRAEDTDTMYRVMNDLLSEIPN